MNSSNVSFGAGLIKYGNEYINPDNIIKFKPWVLDNETVLSFSNDTEHGGIGTSANKIIKVSTEKFADSFIKAQETGNIIDLDA